MNSQTLLTRRFTINFRRSLRIMFAVVLLGFSAATSNAQTFYADWTTSGSALTHNFTLPDGTIGSISRFNTGCLAAGTGFMTVQNLVHVPASNYPSTFYTPTPPSPNESMAQLLDRDGTLVGCSSPFSVVASYSLIFSEPYANPRMHFINIDGASVHIFNSASSPINVFALSWNNEFEIVSNVVNAGPNLTINPFCESNAGANPHGGCGTIVVPGKHTQLILTARDLGDSAGDGDSFNITMSLNADYGDAPTSYDNNGVNEASHDLLSTNLRFGATVDADAAEKSGVPATGDDTTGSDDEDGAGTFQSYFSAGGRMCTGALGTYTTLANEYCTVVTVTNSGASAGQVVGWLDANGDGDFLDAGERSVPLNNPAVDDGSFATGNSPVNSTRLVVLVWTGLPQTLPSNPYFRFRVSRDATFFTDPQPLGAAIDGEVEDHRPAVPTAADAIISGRVVTADGRGIRNAVVVVQGGELSEPKIAVTGAFGYYSFEGLDTGETYIVSVQSKRYRFADPVRVINLGEDALGIDFIASP